MVKIEHIQTVLRIEKRLVTVLKSLVGQLKTLLDKLFEGDGSASI
tara:strand:+ start:2351 stop:2485 length:135 start_codon:yes stop_codon:yes gene_type:complete